MIRFEKIQKSRNIASHAGGMAQKSGHLRKKGISNLKLSMKQWKKKVVCTEKKEIYICLNQTRN